MAESWETIAQCVSCFLLDDTAQPAVVNTGVIAQARGSAYVELGGTKVMAAW